MLSTIDMDAVSMTDTELAAGHPLTKSVVAT
jgi:hypothetical protein